MTVEGTVPGANCQPLPGAELEVWHADDLGRYDNDDPDDPPAADECRCRGRLRADAEDCFRLRTVLQANHRQVPDASCNRVEHLHVRLSAPGYTPWTTEIGLLPDEHVHDDVLFDPDLAVGPEPVPEGDGGRPAYRARCESVLTAVSGAGYAQPAARLGCAVRAHRPNHDRRSGPTP